MLKLPTRYAPGKGACGSTPGAPPATHDASLGGPADATADRTTITDLASSSLVDSWESAATGDTGTADSPATADVPVDQVYAVDADSLADRPVAADRG